MCPALGCTPYVANYASECRRVPNGTKLTWIQIGGLEYFSWALWAWTGFDWNQNKAGVFPGIPFEQVFRFIYPFFGGTSGAHSVNFINPKGPKIIWSGSLVHEAAGVASSGGTGGGAGNTQIPLTGAAADDYYCIFGVYNRGVPSGLSALLGNWDDTINGAISMTPRAISDGKCYSYCGSGAGSILSAATSSAQGWWAGLRNSSVGHTIYYNKTVLLASTTSTVGAGPDHAVPFGLFDWGPTYSASIGHPEYKSPGQLIGAWLTHPVKANQRFFDHLWSTKAMVFLQDAFYWLNYYNGGRHV